ncbi:MAG TPA: hypothetical protein VF800_18340 [Telluria sp.]|jgi:predicted membrane-bound dolichyl-phosphate-mannose-protein mannosyltransferase
MRLFIVFSAAALAIATLFMSTFATVNFFQHLAVISHESKGLLTLSLLLGTAVFLLLATDVRNKNRKRV